MVPNTDSYTEYGSVGYSAYAESTGGKTFDGRDMPRWSDLPERIQNAWNAAARAIRRVSTRTE